MDKGILILERRDAVSLIKDLSGLIHFSMVLIREDKAGNYEILVSSNDEKKLKELSAQRNLAIREHESEGYYIIYKQ
jgi:hypothetical protein